MIVQRPERDIQVSAADADALAARSPDARMLMPAAMNHVLEGRAPATTGHQTLRPIPIHSLPIDASLVDGIADFVKR